MKENKNNSILQNNNNNNNEEKCKPRNLYPLKRSFKYKGCGVESISQQKELNSHDPS